MSRGVCLRCGANKAAFDAVCGACGHRPEGEGLLIAWLLSEAHLTADRLDAAAARIRDGSPARPSDAMLERARVALGRHASRDAGLSTGARVRLLATSLLVTPLVGIVLWWWWRDDRPRSARQALALSLPASAGLFLVVAWLWLRASIG